MRILQIIATLRIGGAEKVARDIGLKALSMGDEVHYLVFDKDEGELEEDLITKDAKVIRFPSPSSNYTKFFLKLKQLIKENHYDVVHAHTMFNIGWAMRAAKECGVPVRISHAHSVLNDGYNIKKKIYEKAMRQLILHNATHLIACGNAAGIRLYGETAYQKFGICIFNGIDTKAYAYSADKRQEIRRILNLENSFIIGHVGHLAKVKNQSFLIRMMPDILRRRPNAKLLMLGEGEDRIKLEHLIRELNLTNSVIMTGNVCNVSDYLSAMDVFVFPSLYEGMPLSVIEVQANGLPCVLSEGVPKDVFLTDLVKQLSLEQTEQWVNTVCAAERKAAEKYASELQIQGFDIESVMQKYVEIYKRAEEY